MERANRGQVLILVSLRPPLQEKTKVRERIKERKKGSALDMGQRNQL